ncbi:hypothetical protein F4808DRAFT_471499 [Astrocystis sublimbata]|nr:hypothetical protein F4808DRAFT_471499 [Astrocystis sublimbata]
MSGIRPIESGVERKPDDNHSNPVVTTTTSDSHQQSPNSTTTSHAASNSNEVPEITSSGQSTHNSERSTHDRDLKPKPSEVKVSAKFQPILRHRKTPIFLLILYLPTLIVPWVLLFILAHRPLSGTSYFDQSGNHFAGNASGLTVADLLKTVNAVLAVPILSTLLAYAAVVYAMRRQETQKLNLQQLFALADKGWTDVLLLFGPNKQHHSSRFLWRAAFLVAIGAVLQPLTSLLVSIDPVAVTTCHDIPVKPCDSFGPPVVGHDPEPADMPYLQPDIVLQEVVDQLATTSDLETQPNLWSNNPDPNAFIDGIYNPLDRGMLFAYIPSNGNNPDGFFVTALMNGTNTGVLREHAIRLNSSVHCELILHSDFPSPCPGGKPFKTHVKRQLVELRVCAPGNMSAFPFTPSRNRQDITEDLYLDLQVFPDLDIPDIDSYNFTTHCTASTSRGYFELGNVQNKFAYGQLLDKWPSPEYIAHETNDFRGIDQNHARPTEEDSSSITDDTSPLEFYKPLVSPFTNWNSRDSRDSVPGPLMVSAQVLFGNYSFVNQLADDPNSTNLTSYQQFLSVCEHSRFPFTPAIGLTTPNAYGYCSDAANINDEGDSSLDFIFPLSQMLIGSMQLFNDTAQAEYALIMSMYYANRAMLVKTASGEGPFARREIYFGSGITLNRPSISLPALVIITLLILLQILGLCIVMRLIYSVPTWASTLDALEMARIGQAVGVMPTIGDVRETNVAKLLNTDALIGVQGGRADRDDDDIEEGGDADSEVREDTADNTAAAADAAETVPIVSDSSTDTMRLALGGKGVITRKIAKVLADSKKVEQ